MQETLQIDLAPVAAGLLAVGRDIAAPALVTVPMPRDLVDVFLRRSDAESMREASVAWRAPGGPLLLGYGLAFAVTGAVDAPLRAAFARLRECLRAARAGDVAPMARLRLFAGARFAAGESRDPAWERFGGWRVSAPVFLLARDGSESNGSVTVWLQPGSTEAAVAHDLELALGPRRPAEMPDRPAASAEDPARWDAMIRSALGDIERGEYRKVVIARSRRLRPEAPIDDGRVLASLADRYGGCFLFKATAGGSAFVGATPELLCRVRDGRFETASLAGSRRRGATAEADDALRDELLADGKERSEHAIVTESIVASLAPLSQELTVAAEPVVVRHANIQHLFTPVEGRVPAGRDVLDFVDALHPTPAVGGYPAAPALDAITRLEGLDRGWYAGPVGWVDAAGDGEFAVALRSALLADGTATLYAGAGIVECSEPGREWAETELKFRPLMDAIGG